MEDARADFRAFNVAGPKGTTVLDYAHLVARVCGQDIEPLVSGDYRFGDTRHTVSSRNALTELGWQPETPLETVVSDYVEWVRQQPNRNDFYSETEKKMRAADIIRSVRGG